MKKLNKRKQILSSAGEIQSRCICRRHACSCSLWDYDGKESTSEGLYTSAYNMASWGGEPTSISSK